MAKAIFYGFNPPFIGGQQNVLSRQTDDRLIKNDIVQLLLTVPGERLYRPTFGTLLKESVFETLNENDLLTLRGSIVDAITNNEDRVIVQDISVEPRDDGITIDIKINMVLTNNPLVKLDIELIASQTGAIQLVR